MQQSPTAVSTPYEQLQQPQHLLLFLLLRLLPLGQHPLRDFDVRKHVAHLHLHETAQSMP